MRAERVTPPEQAVRLLVESQDGRVSGASSPFLRMAGQLSATGQRTVVFLIDDGVGCAVGEQPDLTTVIEAGGSVVVDDVSLTERAIPVTDLCAGVEVAALDDVAPLLFDPAVKVVWH